MTRAETLRELRALGLVLIFAAGLWTWRLTAADPALPDPKLYPPVALSKVAAKDGWVRPRALIEGTVTLVKREDDNDIHFVVVDAAGNKVICEIIPEMKLPNGHPHVDDKVTVWGVVRWDGEHKWGELHPVAGWRVKP